MKTLVALAIVGFAVGTAAAAGDVCPKTPQWGQVPNFWDPDPTTTAPRKQLVVRYDGRWAGAAQVPLDNGTNASRVRFLEGGAADPALYVAMEIDTTGNDRETFWFAFAPAGATDSNGATLIEVSVKADSTITTPPGNLQVLEQQPLRCGAAICPFPSPPGPPPNCTAACSAAQVTYRILRGVTPTSGLSKFVYDNVQYEATKGATWLSATPGSRAWRGPLYTTPLTPPTGATVMLRIPNANIGAGADQKVWVAAAKCEFLGTGPGSGALACAAQGSWPPPSGTVVETTAGTEYSAPAVSNWALMHRTSACPAGQPELQTAGIQHGATYSVGAAFTYPQNINLDKDGNVGNDPPNWFGARVAMPITSSAGKYKARFFVADWGSQIGNLDVSQWFELDHDPAEGTNPGSSTGSEDLFIRWPPTTMTAAEQKHLACKYSDCTSAYPGCPYPPVTPPTPDPCGTFPDARTHKPHQCTQVRLENTGSSGSYQFARDAMIFNTDFVGASVFWRVATISTKGINTVQPALPAAPPEGRDIYINVRAANLPQTSDEIPAEATTKRLEDLVLGVGKPPANKPPPKEVIFAKNMREMLGHGPDVPDVQRQATVHQQLRTMSLDTVRLVAPTLEFRVFYDTGRVMTTENGTKRMWLEPMTGFGYVVEHIGHIKGWEWALDGAEPVGDNWFRIRVADGNQQQVRTRVQAVEDDRMPPGNPQWPPGKAWLSPAGQKASTKVNLKKKGGCSVGGDASPATLLLLAAALWIGGRRRTIRSRSRRSIA